MFDLIAWRIGRFIDVRQAIRVVDPGAEFVSDDLGIGRNGILPMGERRFDC
ncbi:MAG: hypothetical protein WEB63_01655 [Cucumibacter sp.]